MTQMFSGGFRTWIEIDRKSVKRNFGAFKKLISKKTKLMAVVKSNAYGHGLIDFSKEMERLGADFLGVDSIVEGLALRRAGIAKPILVLGYTLPEMIASASAANISLTVSNFEILRYIVRFNEKFSKPLKIHIKVDTGMHRQGFLLSQQKTLLSIVKGQLSNVQVEGLYTHFAAAKNPAFRKDTDGQITEFRQWLAVFKRAGFKFIAHATATAGTLLFPEAHFDMVRVGIGLYGLWPAREVKEYLRDRVTLLPALTWKSFVTELKRLPKGSRIGYDLTESLRVDSTVALIPVGYWHGYPRALSSVGRVLVKNRLSKVIGRVSMDMLAIDVTGIRGVKVGDEVVLLSPNQPSPASAESIAALTDSSWYEIITRLNPLMKRIYI